MAKLYTRAEQQRRKLRFKIFGGMFDFVSVVAGIVVIIVCILLLAALYRSVMEDIPSTFEKFVEIFNKAVIRTN